MLAAAVALALAVVLLLGPAPQDRMLRLRRRAARQARLPSWVPLAAVVMVVLAVGAGLRAVGWAATAAVTIGTVTYLVVEHRRRRAVRQRVEECARAARVLSGLLRVGQIPSMALAEAAADCAVLRPAAMAARLGGDVGVELERAGQVPGQAGMVSIAAAWRVSQRSGAPVADVLALVAENLRRRRQLQGVIDAELSAARASGHIMAALPLLAVGLGFFVGVNTVEFLAHDPVGQLLLFAGVALTAVGVLWIDRLARSGARETL